MTYVSFIQRKEKSVSRSTVRQAPYYMELPVTQIEIPPYQRSANVVRVKKIATAFEENRMRPIDVSLRDGKYYCYDGQHRLLAYKMMGQQTIPAIVHTTLSYHDEADLFARQSENVSAVRMRDKWNAMVEGGSEKAKKIIEVAKAHGYKIDAKGTSDGKTIMCVTELMKAYDNLDIWGFERMFTIIEQSFKGSPHGVSRDMIAGLVEFIKVFDSDHSKPACVDYHRLYRELKRVTAERVLSEADKFRVGEMKKSSSNGKRVARAIIEIYNGRLQQNRLPLDAFLA